MWWAKKKGKWKAKKDDFAVTILVSFVQIWHGNAFKSIEQSTSLHKNITCLEPFVELMISRESLMSGVKDKDGLLCLLTDKIDKQVVTGVPCFPKLYTFSTKKN